MSSSKHQGRASRALNNVLVTGGAGFIGSNFIRYLFRQPDFTGRVINLDLLTYAGNPENLADIAETYGSGQKKKTKKTKKTKEAKEAKSAETAARYAFIHGDICDASHLAELFRRFEVDTVVHFAAESHVDRSILGPEEFVRTNIQGTFTLLETARKFWELESSGQPDWQRELFHHVSTDEVYGSLGKDGLFTEETAYDPRSPYSASKASSDHLVRAYHHTYGLPVTISNCSNNYGPYQFPEKLIPLMICNMLEGKALPVYGKGENVRDWLFVDDHSSALWSILRGGGRGRTYNIGGETEMRNIDLVKTLADKMEEKTGAPRGSFRELITFVKDRPGHDKRYAIDCSRIKEELGWSQSVDLAEGLSRTVEWYLANPDWIKRVRSGEYREWIHRQYGEG